ncbi:MAG: hypothetical protein LBF86_09415 [Helicobacteraceae bacterium]|jgi:hypothetical protein|nr:hypothetical protein [Helicobacteraceae bacterium]
MTKRSKAALSAALALAAPLVMWANHAIKVNPDQWQLIGITGYYATSQAGSQGQSPDLAGGQVVVDLRDGNDNISWDANTSTNDLNIVTSVGSYNNFATASDLSGVTYVNDPDTATGNNRLGLPYHSIVGLRTLRVGNIGKAAISFARPTKPIGGKDYGASLITMYLVSPYSSGEPDVMVVFAGNLLNQTFKISFKNAPTSKWNFTAGDDRDKVYSGKFSYEATYDNPLRIGAGLSEISATAGTAATQSGYRSFANTIDLNVSDNIAENFGDLNLSNFQALEGNFTAYQYDAVQGFWKIATITDAAGGSGIATINDADVNETGNANNNNVVWNAIDTSDFRAWTKGYGYWVRIWDDAVANTAHSKGGQTGILANDQITSASDYNGLIQNGWNLLSFPDSVLRYTASGFIVNQSVTNGVVVGPFGDSNVSFGGGCITFNKDVWINNSLTGRANALEVSCLEVSGNTIALISSKPFYIYGESFNFSNDVTSLAGYSYAANDLIDLNGSGTGTNGWLRTRLGEYALLIEDNEHYLGAVGNVPQTNTIRVGFPSWLDVPVLNTDANNILTSFASHIAANQSKLKPSYDTAARGKAHRISNGGTNTTGELILLAANSRFYLSDNVAVRLFNLKDGNGSVLSIDYGGSSHTNPAGVQAATLADGAINCGLITSYVSGVTSSDVYAPCYNEDTNDTVAFYSTEWRNYDVKEINASRQLLVERYIGSNETNRTAYGAIERVIQPSQIYGAYDYNGSDGNFSFGGIANLTYTSVWAEDFPTSGALYYLADNGFKPEMILTGVTAGIESIITNSPGTISWKALDTTRDPKAWFDSANDFELFWTEKERGYWVYAQSGYVNPVTVSNVNLNSASVVTKHFNNGVPAVAGSSDEFLVFNWLDGYISATVGGLTRQGYTSGETYTVRARLDSDYIPLTATGAISGSSAIFTANFNDFEVESLRPNGRRDLNVTATDGLGGRASSGVQIAYLQPAAPDVNLSGNTLTATSDANALGFALFAGDVSDENNGANQRVGALPANNGVAAFNLGSINIEYPDEQEYNSSYHDIIAYDPVTNPDPIVDLRVVAATASNVDDRFSVYSNMRKVNYVPAYSNTFHLYANGEQNTTKHTAAFGNAEGNGYDANTGDDVAFRGANARELTLIYQPINPNQGLANNAPQHANLNLGGAQAQIEFLPEYAGEIFYVYDHSNNAWYYGVFPGMGANGSPWGASGYGLKLATLPVTQTVAKP